MQGLLLILFCQFTLGLAFINYFCRAFEISRLLIPVHLWVLVGFFGATTILPGVLVRFGRFTRLHTAPYLLALAPALGSMLLILVYTIDFAANLWWGSNVHYTVLVAFFLAMPSLHLSNWVFFFVALSGIFVLFIYCYVSRPFYLGLRQLFLPGLRWSLFKTKERARISFVALSLAFILYPGTLYALSRLVSVEVWGRDPLLSLVFETDVYHQRDESVLERLTVESRKARADYPRDVEFLRKNVILIVADSLRPDHMQVYGYDRPTTPFLSSLESSGRLKKVRFATSTCAESNCGILSTLASQPLHALVPESFKLHTLLHDQGYNSFFILSGNHDWYGLRESYGSELSLYFDGTSSERYLPTDDRVLFEGLEMVPGYAGKPAFFFFHLMSSHLLGVRQDEYRAYHPSDLSLDWESLLAFTNEIETHTNFYDNGVLQADAIIQQLFSWLEREGYLRGSLVIILSDHGEALGTRGVFGHVSSLYQDLIRIPLLIADDEGRPYANLNFATQIDVAPTIIDRLGLPIPSSWQGYSLLKGEERSYSLHQTRMRNPIYALLHRTDRAIYKYLTGNAGRNEELYELLSDPGEERNLIATADPSFVDGLRQELKARLSRF